MNEALRLAQFLENDVPPFSAREVKTAAAELRRLHALNAELVEALRLADLMLSGANMDSKAVERSVKAALANSKVNLEGKAK